MLVVCLPLTIQLVTTKQGVCVLVVEGNSQTGNPERGWRFLFIEDQRTGDHLLSRRLYYVKRLRASEKSGGHLVVVAHW